MSTPVLGGGAPKAEEIPPKTVVEIKVEIVDENPEEVSKVAPKLLKNDDKYTLE